MSNFSEDEDLTPPLPETETEASPSEGGTGTEDLPPPASFDEIPDTPAILQEKAPGMPLPRRILRGVTGLVILCFALGIWWSLIPMTFDVQAKARSRAEKAGHVAPGQPLPVGYTTIATLTEIAELIVRNKPGGLMSNDWNPISRITDNIRNWEKGALVQIRIIVQGLRFDLTRIGPQSLEHPELAKADPLFNFKETSLLFPSSESQYKLGIRELSSYLKRMSEGGSQAEFFVPRQDQLIRFLGRLTVQLGNYAALLQRNVRHPPYDANALISTSSIDFTDPAASRAKVHSIWKRDDVFYEARGAAFVIYHILMAIRSDCETLLNNSQAWGAMNRVLNELHSANLPMTSPIVLNGEEFGAFQNHSLVLASHLARAHLAIQELQLQLSGGARP